MEFPMTNLINNINTYKASVIYKIYSYVFPPLFLATILQTRQTSCY